VVKSNPGHLPADAIGKRVRGVLRNGEQFSDWAADGRGGCRWTLRQLPHDIVQYEIAA
jgi:hypothetical protein